MTWSLARDLQAQLVVVPLGLPHPHAKPAGQTVLEDLQAVVMPLLEAPE